MEISDEGKLGYDPFLLQVYHQSMVLCQLFKEDPNLFFSFHFEKKKIMQHLEVSTQEVNKDFLVPAPRASTQWILHQH